MPASIFPAVPPAILLAAGLGSRLRPVVGERPKALLEVGGRTLLDRSVERLRAAGVERLVAVVGYRAAPLVEAVERLWPGVEIVENPDFADTGSMRSLALAAARCPDGALVLESDLIYEARALPALLGTGGGATGGGAADGVAATVLLSGPTGAGDEVRVTGDPDGRVREIGKGVRAGGTGAEVSAGPTEVGEFVGLSRIDGATLRAMASSHLEAGHAARNEHYEERLSALAGAEHPVRWIRIDDLAWAEIDREDHLERALRVVLPRIEGVA